MNQVECLIERLIVDKISLIEMIEVLATRRDSMMLTKIGNDIYFADLQETMPIKDTNSLDSFVRAIM